MGTVYHELGHAIAMWIMGGQVARITINPFSWSYTYYASIPKYPIFATWSGALLGSLLGLIIMLIAKSIPSTYAVPFVFSGMGVMVSSGGYFILDLYTTKSGDPTNLLDLGIPRYMILMTGFILLAAGIYFLIGNIELGGIEASDSLLFRIVVFGWGIFPYFGLRALYVIWYDPVDVLEAVIVVFLAVFFIVLVALSSMKRGHRRKARNIHITWFHVVYAVILGVGAIAVPLLVFGT